MDMIAENQPKNRLLPASQNYLSYNLFITALDFQAAENDTFKDGNDMFITLFLAMHFATYRVSQKKCASDFSSHYWHKYFTHIKNKDRYGILIISAFHTIFCFYPTPFQSLAIVRQSTSPPKSNTLF